MVKREQPAPRHICTIADHLDVVLAAGEDLLKIDVTGDQASRVRLELTAITHVLQARHRLQEVKWEDSGLALQAVLFIAGTAAFEELVRSEAQTPPLKEVTEAYLVGRRVPLGVLADLAAGMLAALEQFYALYGVEEAAPDCIVTMTGEIWQESDTLSDMSSATSGMLS